MTWDSPPSREALRRGSHRLHSWAKAGVPTQMCTFYRARAVGAARRVTDQRRRRIRQMGNGTSGNEQELDYSDMRKFLLVLCRVLDTYAPDHLKLSDSFAAVIAKMDGAGPKTRSRQARQVIAILLEGTIDFTPAQVAAADAMCKAADAPLLSAVRAPFWRKVPKILARRKIRNQEEYYLVVERLNDVGPTGLA